MNLIYISIGHNPKYIEMLRLHLESLERFYDGKFEFLVITDCDISIKTTIPLNYHFTKCESVYQSATNKLKIYQYSDLHKYDGVISCDADSIWNKSPMFETIKPGFVSVSNEQQLMNHPSEMWGNYYLTEAESEDITKRNILGVNGGVFGFKSNMANHFKNIEEFTFSYEPNFHSVWEQSFLNVYLYRNNILDNSFESFVHNCYDENFDTDKSLIHFLGGENNEKISRMKRAINL